LKQQAAIGGKVSAEQDRDLFQEQYAKGFSDGNTQPEKQIKITTTKPNLVGLNEITFELRTNSLEVDGFGEGGGLLLVRSLFSRELIWSLSDET
jgi:hypothetical protein